MTHKVKNHGGYFMVGSVITGPIRDFEALSNQGPLGKYNKSLSPLGKVSRSLFHWGFSLYSNHALSFCLYFCV